MKPAPSILRSIALASSAPGVLLPTTSRLMPSPPGLAKATFQRGSQSVLDYLVATLRKSW